MAKRLVSIVFISGCILIAAFLVIFFGRGYRPDLKKKTLNVTGLLVATSFPNGAQVFVNGKLKTATDNTINLAPGFYDVKIVKDGYFPWEKRLKIQGEIVTKTDARLFSTTPSLRALTNAGVVNAVVSFEGNNIVYGTATGSAQKSGVYILNLNERQIIGGGNRQISKDTLYFPLSKANFIFSPDGKQVMAYFTPPPPPDGETLIGQKEKRIENAYLLATDKFNETPQDISLTYEDYLSDWNKEIELNEKQRINSLKSKKLRDLVKTWSILGWTLNETKILYTATASASIPEIIKPPLIGTNSQKETRDLETGRIYVYDIKEDKNFEIGSLTDLIPDYPLPIISPYPRLLLSSYPLLWLEENHHLILAQKDKIQVMEYDGFNKTVIYAGPFLNHFIVPSPDSSRLIILTNYNPVSGIEANLYAINLQ